MTRITGETGINADAVIRECYRKETIAWALDQMSLGTTNTCQECYKSFKLSTEGD